MKVAIVHDWLNQKVGGAENVLFEVASLYPEADIFTLVYNRRKFAKYFSGRKIKTSRLQYLPWFIKSRPKLLLPFVKGAVEALDFSEYDLVISLSTAWVKNINVGTNTRHICYCHSPARMLWDSWPSYIDDMKLGPIRRFAVISLTSRLRLWDYYKSQRNIKFIANSRYIAGRIKKYYRQPAEVVYPPVEVNKFKGSLKKEDYYLIISVLSKYKNIDLAVRAFIKNGKKLKIAGDGPELDSLSKLAKGHDNIEILGRVSESQKIELLQHSQGFIFCSIEDFGITMVESIAAGTAVLAVRGGGANEIVMDGKSGMFFDKSSIDDLNMNLKKFDKVFNGNYRLNNDYVFRVFSNNRFAKEFKRIVNEK